MGYIRAMEFGAGLCHFIAFSLRLLLFLSASVDKLRFKFVLYIQLSCLVTTSALFSASGAVAFEEDCVSK